MSIFRKAFKIFNGSSWDEYHLKTDSKQVVHTKADGTDTTVEEQLLALNSTLIREKITFQAYMSTTAIGYQNCYFIPAENKVHIELLLQGGSNAISYDGFICHADKKYMPSEARDLMMMYRTKEGNVSPGYCFASHDTSRPYLWIKHTESITMTDALILGEYAL